MHTIYDTLKDFQPVLTAAVALVAACIAYFGATAKVRLDRQIAREELARQKMALFLRLRFEISLVSRLAKAMRKRSDDLFEELIEEMEVVVGEENLQFRGYSPFRSTPEMDEAWQKLQLFPLYTATDLDRMRRRIALIRHYLDSGMRDKSARDLSAAFKDLHEIGEDLTGQLDHQIADIHGELDR